MFTKEIICSDDIKLVKPDVERDVPISICWLKGEEGKQTLRLMGNVIDDDFEPNEQEEAQRINDFLNKDDQLNWMIDYKGLIIGAVWVDLVEKNKLKAPSVHIMIGDKSARGNGVGTIAEAAVIEHLIQRGFNIIYSRALISNQKMLHVATKKLSFKKDGSEYIDDSGLTWQNLIYQRNNI
jgi:RimJ/RimL family protein N-acetyltransferase